MSKELEDAVSDVRRLLSENKVVYEFDVKKLLSRIDELEAGLTNTLTHTLDEDFAHFLTRTGLHRETPHVRAMLRQAYEDGRTSASMPPDTEKYQSALELLQIREEQIGEFLTDAPAEIIAGSGYGNPAGVRLYGPAIGPQFVADARRLSKMLLEICGYPTECPRELESEAISLAEKLKGEE